MAAPTRTTRPREPRMTPAPGPEPHPIYLAGRWVESPDRLVVTNPARPDEPAGATYYATPEQYEEAVAAAVAAFEKTRRLPAFERSAALRQHQRRHRGPTRGDRAAHRHRVGQADPRRTGRGRPGRADLPDRRRGGRAHRRRGHPARPEPRLSRPDRHRPPLPHRPDRGHQPVQLPAEPGRAQAGAGHRLGQPDRPQAALARIR